jgi:serine/threonine protein kinase
VASPVARVDRRKRPATSERPARASAASLAETTPFYRDEPPVETFGPYAVYEKLGEGGMACVHRAELVCESGLRKPVALKRLRSESAEDPQLVDGFVREAQLAARLTHPNIAQSYDLGRIDGTYFMAMELVPGPTLSQVLTMTRNGAGAVPLPIALEILIEIADALDHAHDLCDEGGRRLELVHRDISPMNIVISRTGAAKLIDFGIAKVRSARATTEAGIIKGNLAYLSPEYTYGRLDRRSDLFGFGVVAHELLTGQRLFAGASDLATICNVRELVVPPPSRLRPGISPELDAIVLKALERDPDQRWQTAGELRNALVVEARLLGIAISGPQIRDWVEWAFQQAPRRDSSVDRMLDDMEPSISIQIHEGTWTFASVPIDLDDFKPSYASVRVEFTEPVAPISVPIALQDTVVAKTPRPARPRRPAWRPPTRWSKPPPRRSVAPYVVLAVLAVSALAIDQHWIDQLRQLIDSWI